MATGSDIGQQASISDPVIARTRFVEVTERFRGWAAAQSREYGERERDWPDWTAFYSLSEPVLGLSPGEVDDYLARQILYMLARDNEIQELQRGLTFEDHDAWWQLADRLRTVATDAARRLLSRYAADEDEYVRRRALGAMVALQHPATEETALAAWRTGELDAQLMALHALSEVEARSFAGIHKDALRSHHRHVRQRAEELASP